MIYALQLHKYVTYCWYRIFTELHKPFFQNYLKGVFHIHTFSLVLYFALKFLITIQGGISYRINFVSW